MKHNFIYILLTTAGFLSGCNSGNTNPANLNLSRDHNQSNKMLASANTGVVQSLFTVQPDNNPIDDLLVFNNGTMLNMVPINVNSSPIQFNCNSNSKIANAINLGSKNLVYETVDHNIVAVQNMSLNNSSCSGAIQTDSSGSFLQYHPLATDNDGNVFYVSADTSSTIKIKKIGFYSIGNGVSAQSWLVPLENNLQPQPKFINIDSAGNMLVVAEQGTTSYFYFNHSQDGTQLHKKFSFNSRINHLETITLNGTPLIFFLANNQIYYNTLSNPSPQPLTFPVLASNELITSLKPTNTHIYIGTSLGKEHILDHIVNTQNGNLTLKIINYIHFTTHNQIALTAISMDKTVKTKYQLDKNFNSYLLPIPSTYTNTGTTTFSLPNWVKYLTVIAIGGSGGNYQGRNILSYGSGGAIISLLNHEIKSSEQGGELVLSVGGAGSNYSMNTGGGDNGGYNGGGAPGNSLNGDWVPWVNGGGGGGASTIQINNNYILIAGGGGGATRDFSAQPPSATFYGTMSFTPGQNGYLVQNEADINSGGGGGGGGCNGGGTAGTYSTAGASGNSCALEENASTLIYPTYMTTQNGNGFIYTVLSATPLDSDEIKSVQTYYNRYLSNNGLIPNTPTVPN